MNQIYREILSEQPLHTDTIVTTTNSIAIITTEQGKEVGRVEIEIDNPSKTEIDIIKAFYIQGTVAVKRNMFLVAETFLSLSTPSVVSGPGSDLTPNPSQTKPS